MDISMKSKSKVHHLIIMIAPYCAILSTLYTSIQFFIEMTIFRLEILTIGLSFIVAALSWIIYKNKQIAHSDAIEVEFIDKQTGIKPKKINSPSNIRASVLIKNLIYKTQPVINEILLSRFTKEFETFDSLKISMQEICNHIAANFRIGLGHEVGVSIFLNSSPFGDFAPIILTRDKNSLLNYRFDGYNNPDSQLYPTGENSDFLSISKKIGRNGCEKSKVYFFSTDLIAMKMFKDSNYKHFGIDKEANPPLNLIGDNYDEKLKNWELKYKSLITVAIHNGNTYVNHSNVSGFLSVFVNEVNVLTDKDVEFTIFLAQQLNALMETALKLSNKKSK